MTILTKNNSVSAITVYSIAVFAISFLIICFALYSELHNPLSFTLLLGILSLLLIWHFGIKFPYIGLVSMERLVQFHMLLTLPLLDTIVINMCAGFIMPYINKSYRLGSFHVAMLRGFSNAGMNGIMILVAGLLLRQFSVLPFESLNFQTFGLIMAVALIMQIINISMIAIYHTVDNKNFKKLLSPALVFADLIFVPIGILSAMLFQLDDMSYFYLFALFVLLIMFSFNSLQVSNASPGQIISSTKYKSNYLDIQSVSKAMNRRLNDIFSFDELYLGAFNKDLQILERYHETYKKEGATLSQEQLVDISKETKLSSKILEINSTKMAVLTSPFIDQNGCFAFICLLKTSQVPYTTADINLLQLFIQRYNMGLSYAITYKNLSEYKNTLEERVKHRTLALEEVNTEKTLLVEELKELAHRDGLTGLHNRRVLDDMLMMYKEKPVDSICLAVIDIDFFKKVNDDFGHETGDKVLQQLAHVLNKNHAHDMKIIRYGGEEFVLLIDNINKQVAIDYCNNLLSQISGYGWAVVAPSLKITISIGLACYPETGIDELFSEADKMLYKAKENGRDQLVY